MKKIIFGIISVFLSINLAVGSCFIIWNQLPQSSQVETEKDLETGKDVEIGEGIDIKEGDDNKESFAQASENWLDKYGSSHQGSTGNGTIDNPHKISNGPQLARIAWLVNNNQTSADGRFFNDQYYEITANIDLSAHYWTPIGKGTSYFRGTFRSTQGKCFTISGITLYATRNELTSKFSSFYSSNSDVNFRAVGLFGAVNNAELSDFNVDGTYSFEGKNEKSQNDAHYPVCVGGAVGIAMGSTVLNNVNNVGVDVNFSVYSSQYTVFTNYLHIGGIVGRITESSSLLNCTATEDVYINIYVSNGASSVTPGYNLGGVTGICDVSKIYNCYSYANIVFENPSSGSKDTIDQLHIGGIVGEPTNKSQSFEIESCVFSGRITTKNNFNILVNDVSKGGGNVGGIVGFISSTNTEGATVRNCQNYGIITISEIYGIHVGGILGYSGARIKFSNCANFGNLDLNLSRSAEETRGYGGIIGKVAETSSLTFIDDCANYVNVTVKSDKNSKFIGGIIGYGVNNIYINRCINYGKIEGNLNSKCVGGIAGELGAYSSKEANCRRNYAIYNCVNYAPIKGGTLETVSGKGSSAGQIAGFMIVRRIYTCVINGDLSSLKSVAIGSYAESGDCSYRSPSYQSMCKQSFFEDWFEDYSKGITIPLFNIYIPLYQFEPFSGKVLTNFSTDKMLSSWMISSHVFNYYSESERTSKNMSNMCVPVPMSALAPGKINISWTKPDKDNPNPENQAYMGEVATPRVYAYSTSGATANTITDQAPTSTPVDFCYLKGVDYYSTSRLYSGLLKIENNSNFIISSVASTSKYNNLYYTSSSNVSSVRFKKIPMLNSYNAKDIETFEINVIYTSKSSSSINIEYYKIDANDDTKITRYYHSYKVELIDGEFTRTDGSAGSLTLLKLRTGQNVSSSYPAYYKDVISWIARPEVGYYFSKLTLNGFDIDKKVLENVENTDFGEMSGVYLYNFCTTVKVYFKAISYNYTIFNSWNSTGYLDTQTRNYFNVDYPGIDINAKVTGVTNGYDGITYGYKYSIYLCGYARSKSDINKNKGVLIKTIEVSDLKKLSITTTEMFYIHYDGSKSRFEEMAGKIGESPNMLNSFSLYIEREVINYTVNLHNMLNSFNQLDVYTEVKDVASCKQVIDSSITNFDLTKISYFGSGSNSIVLNVENLNKFAFIYQTYNSSGRYGYSATSNVSFNIGKGYSSVTTVSAVNSAISGKTNIIKTNGENTFADWLEYALTKMGTYNKGRWDVSTSGSFDIRTFYTLQKYGFIGKISRNDTEVSSSTMSISVVSKEKNKGAADKTMTYSSSVSDISFYAPVQLTLNSIPSGYKFEGWYIGAEMATSKLLSLETTYVFLVNPYISTMNSVCIWAKFTTYDSSSNNVVANSGIYNISSANDLIWLSQQVESGKTFSGIVLNQTNDIDMSGVVLNPIGSTVRPFMGIYNGNNFTISNLNLANRKKGTSTNMTLDYQNNLSNRGLFGYVEGATIKNLTLIGGKFSGYDNVGSFVGYAKNSTFENLNNKSCEFYSTYMNFFNIYGNVTSVYLVQSSSSSSPASNGTSEKSYSIRSDFGGLVGLAQGCSFVGCSNRASMTVSFDLSNVGGIAGLIDNNCLINQCFNEGTFFTTSLTYGIANGNRSKITNSYYKYKSGSNYYYELYNATTSSGGNFGENSGDLYNPNNVTLSSSIWFFVNENLSLKIFYWN